jgi:enoyl-[acyl-carrier protein] reductase I
MTEGGSIVTVTFLGSRWVVHNYNTMGVAKASLEEAVRILAINMGQRNIRVNGISSGPIRTLAASGVNDFVKLLRFSEKYSPLRRNVSTAEVGATTAFLLSDRASAVTGQILDVDAGLSIVVGQMPEVQEL